MVLHRNQELEWQGRLQAQSKCCVVIGLVLCFLTLDYSYNERFRMINWIQTHFRAYRMTNILNDSVG